MEILSAASEERSARSQTQALSVNLKAASLSWDGLILNQSQAESFGISSESYEQTGGHFLGAQSLDSSSPSLNWANWSNLDIIAS